MSYSLTISGHKDGLTADEAHALEEDVATKTREFVASLDSVTYAVDSFGNIGSVDFLDAPVDETPAEPTEPTEPTEQPPPAAA